MTADIIEHSPATAELVRDLTSAGLEVKEIHGTHHLVLPQNFKHIELTEAIEKAQNVPERKRGTLVLADVPSLLQYCADQGAADGGYVYADMDGRSITAVFNDNRHNPGWRDHRATFKAEYTPEFHKWLNNDKQHKGQSEFAEFIEDNFADLQGDDAQNLLTVATTMQAKTGINFSSAKRLQDGQTQLVYSETINATAGASGTLQIPQTFTLGLRIFKNGDGFKLTARLKYRLAGGAVKFWYELDRPERAVEVAFAEYVATVREKSGYTVLLGKA